MGGIWEVNEWISTSERGYHNNQVYCGNSFFRAVAEMVKAKRRGAGCVKLEWRG